MAPGDESKTKVPITVITGFLGAGKTTLVNYILTGNHGKKIAVIENEVRMHMLRYATLRWCEIGIDDALVLETREEIFEMNNGCICCTVRGDLIRILNKLLKRKDKFDAIMIETTGLANPAPVIQTFFVDDDVRQATLLDAVLTVVDAKHIMQHLDEVKPDGVVNESVQQIAFADKILLNKLDLVDDATKAAVVKRIRSINKGVDIIESRNCVVDLDKIVGIKAFNLDRLLEDDPDFLDEGEHVHAHDKHAPAHDEHAHVHDEHAHAHGHCDDASHVHDDKCGHGHGHDHAHGDQHAHGHSHLDHKHDDRVTSVGFQMEGSCDMAKLNAWLSKLLNERGPDLYRSKGILSMAGTDDKHVFQGVHQMLQFSNSSEGAGRPWAPGEARVNKVVFIGKNLDREELSAGFKACLETDHE
ncbi:hypothetical protein FOA52_005142 [Chlamydomonas sp. UWO 241]|nr:hypothetical protein FOA52_005142 [Chlamydomonas sp. UWO 241]